MKLVLGVVDYTYADHPESETTGEVANILEEKYHVMQKFFDLHGKDIAKYLEDGIAGALENAVAGQKKINLFGDAMGKTEKAFKTYIDSQEHGIDLKKHSAPKSGARKKRQYKRVKYTTAFIDSGLYRKSFKAWIIE